MADTCGDAPGNPTACTRFSENVWPPALAAHTAPSGPLVMAELPYEPVNGTVIATCPSVLARATAGLPLIAIHSAPSGPAVMPHAPNNPRGYDNRSPLTLMR